MTIAKLRILICLVATALLPLETQAQLKVSHTISNDGKTEIWTITEPTVNLRGLHSYKDYGVVFKPGDGITIEGGGCVQTGGVGATWKRYIDPRADDAPNLYFGTIWIPGTLGNQEPNVLRIKDVVGIRWGVPVDANPAQLYLLLGYIDENNSYGDNGYSDHDDGTDDQCKNSQNAWVRITAIRNAGGKLWGENKTAPFDISSNTSDDNLIMLNPNWAYAMQPPHVGVAPVAENLCTVTQPVPPNAPPNSRPGSEVDPDHVPCVSPTTLTSRDQEEHWVVRDASEDFTDSQCAHANWGPATYTGHLLFESHSTPFRDDDYSWQFVTDGGAGLVGKPADRKALEPEFDSHETIQYFSSPWWSQLQDAVNHGSDDDGFKDAKALFTDFNQNGKFAIISGLLGLDLQHGVHAELHPVYAMAIRVKEDDPADEHWAFFVRMFGDEGFCSSHQHYLNFLPDNKFIFRLPLIWGPNAEPAPDAAADFRAEHSAGDPPTVTFIKDQGVFVTFDMPENPAAKQLIHGEIHLQWMNATAAARHGVHGHGDILAHHEGSEIHNGGAGGLLIPATIKPNNVEDYYGQLLRGLTPAQMAQLRASVPEIRVKASSVIFPRTIRIVRAQAPPARLRTGRRPSVTSVPDPEKVARDQKLSQTILNLSAQRANH